MRRHRSTLCALLFWLLAATAWAQADPFAVHVVTDKSRDLPGVRVYAFTEAGSYTGKSAVSGETGGLEQRTDTRTCASQVGAKTGRTGSATIAFQTGP